MPARLYAVPDEPVFDPDDNLSEHAAPADLDAERAVIGAAMLSSSALAEMRTLIEPEDFYRPAHETIWHALCQLADAGHATDAVALAAKLAGELGKVGAPRTCISALAACRPRATARITRRSCVRSPTPGAWSPSASGSPRWAAPRSKTT